VTATTATLHQYAGAEWVRQNIAYRKKREDGKAHKVAPVPYEMSEFGAVVANILGYVFRGIYHMDPSALNKVDWSRNWVKVKAYRGHHLATWDGAELTELVLLCHHLCIRFSVSAEFGGRLCLNFHKRKRDTVVGENRICEGHPTVEEAVERVRKVLA
jgi:hypothetical protein